MPKEPKPTLHATVPQIQQPTLRHQPHPYGKPAAHGMAARGAYEVDDDEYSTQGGAGDYGAATGSSSSKRAAYKDQKASLPRGSACLVCRKRKRAYQLSWLR